MPLGFSPIGSSSIGASSQEGIPAAIPTFTIRLTDRNGVPASTGLSLQAVWFDQNQPQNFTAPVWQGVLTVQVNGVITHELINSTLNPGEAGWLILTDSDGTPDVQHKAFSGPVAVT